MLVGYARTSTLEQKNGFEAQLDELSALNCDKIFREQVSSIAERPELDAAISFCREGDIFVVTRLDRLARSIQHLWKIVEELEAKGVYLRVLNLGIDTSSPTGKLILTILGGISQFERELMLERQREGIQRAKEQGKYKGRAPTAMAKAKEVRELKEQGTRPTDIAKKVGISRASVYRVLSRK
jgi:DNA invertase Pin-like site-specific DNA recombinase